MYTQIILIFNFLAFNNTKDKIKGKTPFQIKRNFQIISIHALGLSNLE